MRSVFSLLCLALVGCPKDEHAPAPGLVDAPSSSTADFPLPSKASATASTPPPINKPLPCRAIAVVGKITDADAGTSLSMGGQMSDTLFTLDDGAKMTVKAPESGRELTFEGPGSIRACVAGDPEHWLLKGTAMATPNSGEKPGSEEWIITPNGIVRYASTLTKIKVEKDRTTVKVINGVVSVFAPKPALGADAGAGTVPAPNTWTDVTSATPVDLLAPGPVKPLVDACASAAKEARDLGAQVAVKGANLADLAPKHVEARRKARAMCALARVAAAAGTDKTLVANAEASDAEWRVVVH